MKEVVSEEPAVTVSYQRQYPALFLLAGIFCSVVFLVGAFFLEDYSILFYLILSSGLIYIGWWRFNHPYLKCYHNRIEVSGLFGENFKVYSFTKKDLVLRGKRIWLKNEKLKFNHWFVRRDDYKKMIDFYFGGDISEELKEN